MALSATKLDHPLVFAVSITFVVIGMAALLGWAFSSLGWTGPLSLIKGGVHEGSGLALCVSFTFFFF